MAKTLTHTEIGPVNISVIELSAPAETHRVTFDLQSGFAQTWELPDSSTAVQHAAALAGDPMGFLRAASERFYAEYLLEPEGDQWVLQAPGQMPFSGNYLEVTAHFLGFHQPEWNAGDPITFPLSVAPIDWTADALAGKGTE